jgi:hypothetical protein
MLPLRMMLRVKVAIVVMIETGSIIDHYYHDYIDSEFITESELQELYDLICIIFLECMEPAPTYDDVMATLRGLRGTEAVILDLVFVPSETVPYLEMLHSRELAGDQRTSEWKMQRHNYITASVSAACAGLMGPVARSNQLLEKASMGEYSPFKGGYYTDIGNIFEPVTNNHYSYINNTRIHDFALIPHNKIGWEFLAASTDGVAQRGTELTNIEIKTLPGRVPDGKIKKEYYHQMQHQMECLGLQHTDFIEVKYEETNGIDRKTKKPIGIIMEMYSDGRHIYEYSPAGSTVEELERWKELREEAVKECTDRIFTRWIYWVQTHYSCIRVDRQADWLRDMGPQLKQFYKEVCELRADPVKVQRMIREREQQKNTKSGSISLSDCLI